MTLLDFTFLKFLIKNNVKFSNAKINTKIKNNFLLLIFHLKNIGIFIQYSLLYWTVILQLNNLNSSKKIRWIYFFRRKFRLAVLIDLHGSVYSECHLMIFEKNFVYLCIYVSVFVRRSFCDKSYWKMNRRELFSSYIFKCIYFTPTRSCYYFLLSMHCRKSIVLGWNFRNGDLIDLCVLRPHE